MSKTVHSALSTEALQPEVVAALFGRYEVLGVIGQGGMGTVYKGYHLSLKRFVAIKVLRINQIKSPRLEKRFLREMHAVGQMDHPNVVRAGDAGQANGLFYLVMEFLEGKDLSQLIEGRGRLDPADACELARQAALGLDYIHQTLVHRDIKPSNLLLTPAGLVKVLDLGLARLHETDIAEKEQTPEGCALGTFDYMAPEQANGSGGGDGRTDIYSLGCTLFKLLTGRAPFTGPHFDTIAQKLYAHVHIPLTAVREFQLVPEGLRPTLLRMTAKDPAERYPTAGEAARALSELAVGSQPIRLLGAWDADETAVKSPLKPSPELSQRLTATFTGTRPSNLGALPSQARRRTGLALVLGAGLFFVLGLLSLLFFFMLGWGRPGGPEKVENLELTAPKALADDRDLLAKRPVVLMKPKKDFEWNYDPGKREISFLTSDLCLFQLGESSTGDYGFEALVSRNTPDSWLGLFFGYHRGADGKRPDIGRFYAFTIRPLNPILEKQEGAALELYHFLIDFDTGNRVQRQSPFSVRIPTPRGNQRIRVRVEKGKIAQLLFGATDLADQLAALPPLEKSGGRFGVFSEQGAGFVRAATLPFSSKEP